MRRLALLAALLAAPAASAQDAPADGAPLMEDGLRQFMEGLSREVAPMLDELEALRREAAPMLERLEERLGEAMGNLDAYHPPEILPNGDILLRRREPLDAPEAAPEPLPDAEGAIEL